MNKEQIASYIDHTLLAPDADVRQITQLCKEALSYNFASVCVNPVYVPFCATMLADSKVKVCTVIGFPLGANSSKIKALEAKDAIKNGADEIDMVINIGAARDGRFSVVGSDIAGVVRACRKEGERVGKKIIVKVILETCLLDDDTIKMCCLCANKAGADYVKTSTGFATPKGMDGNLLPNGASVHHVKLMYDTVGDKMKIKASGGIRSVSMAISLLEAGASRLGTSSGTRIVEAWDDEEEVRLRG